MKEYKEGKQKTATMVNKRRLSPPSIYEGSSPVYFSVAFYRKILFLPPSSALLWPPFWVTLARVRFQPFWTTKILETSSFSRQTAPPTGPSFQLERREPRGGEEEGPRFEQFLLALTLCPPKGGKKKKKKKEKKGKERKNWRKLRLLLLRKVIVPWWRPIRKCFAREEDWALAGCWLSHNRGKEESGEVEGGDGRRWLKGNKSTRESKWGTCRAFCGPDTTGYYPSFR